jgi:hypothetical protein
MTNTPSSLRELFTRWCRLKMDWIIVGYKRFDVENFLFLLYFFLADENEKQHQRPTIALPSVLFIHVDQLTLLPKSLLLFPPFSCTLDPNVSQKKQTAHETKWSLSTVVDQLSII